MKPVSYKRILSYLVDVLVVAFIGSLLTFFIPVSDTYEEVSSSLTDVIEDFSDGKIKEDEYLKKVNDISYTLSKESITSSIVLIVVSIVYYVVFAYYNNGQTLGKKLLKIKITSNNDKKLSMNNYLIRCLIINSVLVNIISIATILLLNKANYLKVNDTITTIFGAIYVVTFAMILFRKDGRGLHDILAGTIVVSTSEESLKEEVITKDNTNSVEEIEEAEIIVKEKPIEDKKSSKKMSKTSTSTKPKTTTRKTSTPKKNSPNSSKTKKNEK